MPIKIEKLFEADTFDLDSATQKARYILLSGIRSKESLEKDLKLRPGQIDLVIEKLAKECGLNPADKIYTLMAPNFGKLSVGNINAGEWIKFAAIGDTHLCCKEERLAELHSAYDLIKDEGITTVYHAGNHIDGYKKGINDVSVLSPSMDDQALYFIDNYPQRDGVKTLFVTGDDHEGWWIKQGINVGWYTEKLAVENGRNDLEYIGHVEADIEYKTPNGSSIIKVSHPGGGCFTEGAEILTRDRGWIDFSDLRLDDYVASMTKDTHEFIWEKPERIINKHYKGPVYDVSCKAFSCTVTPEHGFWVRDYCAYARSQSSDKLTMPQKSHPSIYSGWQRVEACDIALNFRRQKFQFPTACNDWVGKTPNCIEVPEHKLKVPGNSRNAKQLQHVGKLTPEDAAELIAWYVAEGYADRKRVSISQYEDVNPDNYEKIKNMFDRIGLRYYANHKSINICSVELSKWLRDECGCGSKMVHLPKWLKDCTCNILEIVLSTMISGDGWTDNKGWFGYKSISNRLLGDLAEIAQKLGYAVNGGKNGTLYIKHRNTTPTLQDKPIERQYNGKIYCCTVSSGLIYVRHHHGAFWSHNSSYARSYQPQKMVESYEGGEKPAILIQGHYHVSNFMQDRNVFVINLPGFQDQTVFGRKKRLRFEVGFAIIQIKLSPNDGSVTRCKVEFIRYFTRGYYKKYLRSDCRVKGGHIVNEV